MGPTLHQLFKICDKSFDLITILNIGIDLINNIRILHELGFMHRDLKPSNLVFGNMSYENYDKKDEIGIIDFGNGKILLKPSGKLNYSLKKTKCMGNKVFSSTKALNDKDIFKKDDIISIFYILIYFSLGTLPWIKKKKNGDNLSKSEVIKIRENNPINDLCKNRPKEFIILFEYILNLPDTADPNYDYIIQTFKYLKLKEEINSKKYKNKFKWITLFEDAMNNNTKSNKKKRKKFYHYLKCIH